MKHSVEGKKVLVTGGTGFIGSGLVKGLLAAGAEVRSLDNDSRVAVARMDEGQSNLERITGDIRDIDTVHEAVRGMDCVCHLAYINGTESFYASPELVLEVAVKGMMNILDACVSEGVRDFVLASSSEVYQVPQVVPTDETAPLTVPDVLNPRFSYGGGKIISELLAVNYGRKFFDRTLIVRPHNVYGPNMGREHVIPQFVLRLKKLSEQQPSGVLDFNIQGTGKETRAFIFIEDFIRALLRVIEQGEQLSIYHIGTDREVSIQDLAHLVAKSCSREIQVVPGELLAGSTPRRCPDIQKLRNLGFGPAISLEEGVQRTAEWYLQNHDLLNP
ncbi:MAG TPA: NAD-dependent epimerase/dehydratase family protein [Acidobacteriota bacterium]|nr:NAD-dependent epimerase/dehydratase family protein [Acidobacteriota bacterium]|tara:strand:+ start:21568 stop:22560 length:993 start_codon:yes stop_codon:yes gene_type:complete